jgi:hypothetical protein
VTPPSLIVVMIPSILNWLFSFAALEQRSNLVESYSAFSGIIAPIAIGNPPKKIDAGLDFNTDAPIALFAGLACPPSQFGRCYDISASSSFDAGTDIIGIGDLTVRATIEVVSRVIFKPSVAFSEVSGVVSAGINSELFNNLILSVRDVGEYHTGIMIEQVMEEPQIEPNRWIRTSTQYNGWVMRDTSLLLNGALMSGIQIQYDPSVQDIELPRRLLSRFRFDVAIDDVDQSLLISCTDSLTIAIQPLGTEAIFFHSSLIRHRATSGICRTRVRFRDSDRIVVGRILTRSVDRVLLNYRDKTVGIVGRTGRQDWFEPIIPSVNLYDEPFVSSRMGKEAIIFSNKNDGQLVLANDRPVFTRISADERAFTYVFVRTRQDKSLNRVSEYRAIRNVSGFPIREDPDRIVIGVQNTPGTSDIWIRSCKNFVIVVFRESDRYSLLNMPVPHIRTDNTEPENTDRDNQLLKPCGICHERINLGQMEQRLWNCNHQFHEKCMREYINHGGVQDCPVCASVIEPIDGLSMDNSPLRRPTYPRRPFPI